MIYFCCLDCGRKFQVKDEFAGRSTRCPTFMAPEQAQGQVHDIDQRSDIFALGGLLYALLTLQPPVEKGGGGQASVLQRVAQGAIKRPEERTPKRLIAPELSAIAMRALARKPKDRYPSVEAFRRDLELYQTGHSVSARRDSFREQVWKLIKRNKGASVATAAALVVLLIVVGFFLKINYTARVQAENNYQAFRAEQQRRRGAIPSFLTASRLLLDKTLRRDQCSGPVALEEDAAHQAGLQQHPGIGPVAAEGDAAHLPELLQHQGFGPVAAARPETDGTAIHPSQAQPWAGRRSLHADAEDPCH